MHLFLTGATPADTVRNFELFLRDAVLGIAGGPTPLVFVKGNPFLRAYHKLRQAELSAVINFFTVKEEWAEECWRCSLSAGTFITISKDGVGSCTMIPVNAGPF
uniref:Uncharacterized protein n=1 Tax=Amphimedon queenslandica TaxID=400682 RepID=A0A1X7UZQ9_AMPQE